MASETSKACDIPPSAAASACMDLVTEAQTLSMYLQVLEATFTAAVLVLESLVPCAHLGLQPIQTYAEQLYALDRKAIEEAV